MNQTSAPSIDLLVLDVDGVLTDGSVTLTASGEEIKSFHVRDGSGMKYWQRVGKRIALITGRGSPAVLRRAEELGVDVVRLNSLDKLATYRAMLQEMGVEESRVAAMGDDLPDLPILRHCALPIAVADAVDEVRQAAAYVTRRPGGRGAVREAIEHILRPAGLWDEVLARYLTAGKDAAK